MITVALGTEKFPFPRVLTWLDNAIESGIIPDGEDILVQAGTTPYTPHHPSIKIFDFIDHFAFLDQIKAARISIIHAGIGYFLDHVEINKIPIVVPRQKRYGEHIDDHQMEFCRDASDELHFPVAYIEHDFTQALKNYNPYQKFPTFRKPLIDFLTLVTEQK